jgi:ABC-type nickel/cobalt efflux system permease component RcnA
MSSLVPLLATALVLGAQHSFGPDHVAAVSLFVSRRPSWRRALGLGVRWGIGHSITVVALGGVLALSGLRLPEQFTPLMERLIGVLLIALGVAALLRARRVHGHWHEHDGAPHWHLHLHPRAARAPEPPASPGTHSRDRAAHDHDHRALLGIGMAHGVAGSGALVLMIPVATSAAPRESLLFLAAFGVGTVVSMALFSAAAGWLLSVASRASLTIARGATVVAALASVGIGLWWLLAGGAPE